MVLHLYAPPFLSEYAIRTNQESAARNTLYLLAIHDLVLDYTKHVAHFFFGISNQFIWQPELLLKCLV